MQTEDRCISIVEAMGSNSVQARFSFRCFLSCVHIHRNLDDHWRLHDILIVVPNVQGNDCFLLPICLPVYSGKQMVKGDLVIFSANRSFLLRKRIIDVSVNHLLLQIESNSFMLSIIRFWNRKKKGILSNTILIFDTRKHIETLMTKIEKKITFYAVDYNAL